MRRVGIFYNPADVFHVPSLHGIIDHIRAGARWVVWQHGGPLANRQELAAFLAWKPDGAVVFRPGGKLLDQWGLPWIDAVGPASPLRFDEQRIGSLAAEHLLNCGLRRLACLRIDTDAPWVDLRRRGFVAAAKDRGVSVADVHYAIESSDPILKWIRDAYDPVGIFASNDYFAMKLVGACVEAGVGIPHQAAIIGADDMPIMCELCPVPITSVRIPHRMLARRAAELLDQRLAGSAVDGTEILQPLGVTIRSSTQIEFIADQEVATVLRLVREQVHEGLDVDDVVAACGVGRRTLEQRVRSVLGTTILEQIHRARVEAAERLLAETDQTITSIANSTGWGDLSRFNSAFRKATGLVPSAWRKARRDVPL